VNHLVGAPALQISGLSKTFPGQRALSDVHLSLQSGEIRALVGQNGSGKSTLVKVLSGYHEPDQGAEVLLRRRCGKRSRHARPCTDQSLGAPGVRSAN